MTMQCHITDDKSYITDATQWEDNDSYDDFEYQCLRERFEREGTQGSNI